MKKFKTRKLIIPLIFLLLIGMVVVLSACGGKCKNGHTVVKDAAVEPTCSADGLTEGSHCSVCNEVIKKQETIPATDHVTGTFLLNEQNEKIALTCNTCPKEVESFKAIKSENAWATDKKNEHDVTSYALVYNSREIRFEKKISVFAQALTENTGIKFTPVLVSDYESSDDQGVILVGNTGLKSSKDAEAILESGYNYAIRSIDKKIVIVGKTDEDVYAALDHFSSNYLDSNTNNISVPTCVLGTNPREITLTVEDFHIVIDKDIYDLPYHAYVMSSTTDSSDYVYRLITSFAGRLNLQDKIVKESAALPEKEYVSVYDGVTYEQRTKVLDASMTKILLVGILDHPASVAFRANLPLNSHGFKVIDENTIVIAGHNDVSLEKAMDLFRKELLMKGDDPWTAGYTSIEISDEDWIVDFPTPESNNIKLYNTQTALANTLQFLYRGEGVSEKAFDDYCAKLQRLGYKLHGSVTNLGGNKYATLVNEDAKTVLNVSYNAFAYQNNYNIDDGTHIVRKVGTSAADFGSKRFTVMYPMVKYEPCLRIISSSTEAEMELPAGVSKPYPESPKTVKVNLPPEETLTKDYSYKKVTETSITTVGLPSGSIGMSYIIQLEDGSFVVVDGGYRSSSMTSRTDEGDILYKVLSQLHENAFKDEGLIPSTITIRAWYLTHGHYDHFHNFTTFMYQYGKGDKLDDEKAVRIDEKYKVDVKNILANIVDEPLHNISAGTSKELMLAASYISGIQYLNGGGANFIRAHAGQVLHFANLTIEVLMTPEDFNPYRVANTNDTNTVVRMKISSKDEQSKETTLLMPGDSCIYQGRYLCAAFGDYLKSDMVQMAHHGNIGTETAFYKTVQAKVVWYPNSVSTYKSYSNGSSSWPNCVTGDLLKLDCLEYIYISGSGATWNSTGTNKSGIATITLKFNKTTPLYDAPCDTLNNDALIQMSTTRGDLSDATTPIYKKKK